MDNSDRLRVGDHVTIYPRGKKKIWCADFWRDGVHCRQSLKTPNKKVALQRAIRLDAQLTGGIYHKPPPSVTVRQAAKARKLLIENPVADYKLDKPPLEPQEGPSLEQVNRILAALSEPQLTPIAVLAFTGMRAGEVQRLQPRDIDLSGNWIHIESRTGLKTKSGLSRKVPIHDRLWPMLEALSKQARSWVFVRPPTKKCPSGNQPLYVKKLNEQFQWVVHKLGLPTGRKKGGFTLHSLRHFFETFTINAGIPQRVVDTWLGHRSDRSMAAVYYKLKDDDSQAFMAKVPFGTGKPAADADNKEV